MDLQIIEAKEQTVFFTPGKAWRPNTLQTRARSTKRNRDSRLSSARISNSTTAGESTGQTAESTGERVRWSGSTIGIKHGRCTPQCCEMNVLGYVFNQQGDPCWLKAERESGFTAIDFRRNYSASFVKLCEEGLASAEARSGRKTKKKSCLATLR